MYNSESQYNAYDKTLRRRGENGGGRGDRGGVYDPSQAFGVESQTTKQGVERMAEELKDRKNVERRRKRNLHGAEDVDSINDRNAVFNRKIKRVFDKYTVEIRQNLERGTAL